MATLELTITPDYVQWGVWESVREIMQNAVDENDKGNTMSIKYTEGKGVKIGGSYMEGTLEVRNMGSRLSRKNLLLGGSEKRNDKEARGQFGEGMKLAWASLLRLDRRVWIRTGEERWVPELATSKNFDGATVLRIRTAETKDNDDVFVQIQGVTPEDWEGIQDRLLFLRPPEETIGAGGKGRILLDPKHVGKLYVKGIYVCELPDRYRYGYDLAEVKIDRDRKLADPWSLKMAIRDALMEAMEKGRLSVDEVIEVLDDQGCGEANVFDSEEFFWKTDFHRKVAARFAEVHGDEAAPVSSTGESIEAQHHGMKGVLVTSPLRKVIELDCGKFDERKVRNATDAKKLYGAHELEEDELGALVWAVALVAEEIDGVTLDVIQVVDFVGEKMAGTYSNTGEGERVRVARKILRDKKELLVTIVHEFTHRYGGDGTVAHRDAQDRVFAGMIVRRCSG